MSRLHGQGRLTNTPHPKQRQQSAERVAKALSNVSQFLDSTNKGGDLGRQVVGGEGLYGYGWRGRVSRYSAREGHKCRPVFQRKRQHVGQTLDHLFRRAAIIA